MKHRKKKLKSNILNMNYGTMRKLIHPSNSNISPYPCEYEIHRLCQEQILKQRQGKSSHIVSYRYLKDF